MNALSDYEYDFNPEDRNNTAATIYRVVSSLGKRVLDLGSGPGIVSGRLAKEFGCEVTCADAEDRFLEKARARGVQNIIQVDLNGDDWADRIDGEFDVVLLADVLEHLYDPESVLRRVRSSSMLSESSRVVVSIPNAGYVGVVAELLAGRFTYSETGLLDSTHIRFFTETSFKDMASRSGFVVGEVHRICRPIAESEFFGRTGLIDDSLVSRIRGHHESFDAYQLVFVLHPSNSAGQIAVLDESLDRLNEKLLLSEKHLAGARAEIEQTHTLHSNVTAQRDQAMRDLAVSVKQLDEAKAETALHLAEVSEVGDLLSEAKRRAELARSDLGRLEAVVGRERSALKAEREESSRRVMDARSNVASLEQRVAELTSEKVSVEHEVLQLNAAIVQIHSSGTWRAGAMIRMLLSPAISIAKFLRRRLRQAREPGAMEPATPAASMPVGYAVPPLVDDELPEDLDARARYESAVQVRSFSEPLNDADRRRIAILVWTLDFDEGRGDVYVAVGLGLKLEELGYEVVYVPRDEWHRIPDGADLILAMIHRAEPIAFPPGAQRIAWIRNHTESWIESGRLDLYDAVLCSSESTKATIDAHVSERIFTGLLRIGVDSDLFRPGTESRSGIVSTVNQWGPPRDVLVALGELDQIDFQLGLRGHLVGVPESLSRFCGPPVSFFSLPFLYQRCSVVLDDFNHTTKAFGNVNSRMFEALACGAAVITNTKRGLDEIGLSDVGSWATAPQLRARIDEALKDPAASEKRARLLMDVVRDRHDWSVRAREFDSFVSCLDDHRSEATLVGFFPDYRATNPYQEILYSNLGSDFAAVPVGDVFALTEAKLAAQRGQPFIFHLHWTSPILGITPDEEQARARMNRFIGALDGAIESGASVIWTIHNQIPHECHHPELERCLRQQIVDRADLVHVMTERGRQLLAENLDLAAGRTVVIPHPSYEGHYPDLIDRDAARHDLEIDDDDHVVLFFGEARTYKGLSLLCDAFETARLQAPELRLLVVTPANLAPPQLIDRLGSMDGVTLVPSRLGDDHIQVPMRAADVVALPYSRSLNSGALLLAMTFDRPVVVASDHPPADLVDESCSEKFQSGDPVSLSRALLASRRLRTEEARASASSVSARFAPNHVARQFRDALATVVNTDSD